MTTPIDRAAQAIEGTRLAGNRVLNPEQARDAAQEALESIDVDELADVILFEGDGTATYTAHAIKTWLTGKETK